MGKEPVSREEHRSFPRAAKTVRLQAQATTSSDKDDVVRGRSIDMSIGGVRIGVGRSLEPGDRLRITFAELTFKGERVHLEGRVAWCKYSKKAGHHVAGIEFLGLTQDQLDMLLLLISERGWDDSRPVRPVRVRLDEHMVVEYRRSPVLFGRWRQAASHEVTLREVVLTTEETIPVTTHLKMRMLLPDGCPDPLPCGGVVHDVGQGIVPGKWLNVVRINQIAQPDRLRLAGFLSRKILA